MNQRIKLSTELYDLNRRLALKALDQLEPEQLHLRPQDCANSFQWVLGHIVAARFHLAMALGIDGQAPGDELYGAGADTHEPNAYPSIEELKTAYDDISDKLQERFRSITDGELDGAPPYKVPGIEETLAGLVSVQAFHEAYHVGQLAYIIRLHGCDRLVG